MLVLDNCNGVHGILEEGEEIEIKEETSPEGDKEVNVVDGRSQDFEQKSE